MGSKRRKSGNDPDAEISALKQTSTLPTRAAPAGTRGIADPDQGLISWLLLKQCPREQSAFETKNRRMAPNKSSRMEQEPIPPLLQPYAAFHPWLNLTPWLDKCPSLSPPQPSCTLSSLYTQLWVRPEGQSGKGRPRGKDDMARPQRTHTTMVYSGDLAYMSSMSL